MKIPRYVVYIFSGEGNVEDVESEHSKRVLRTGEKYEEV